MVVDWGQSSSACSDCAEGGGPPADQHFIPLQQLIPAQAGSFRLVKALGVAGTDKFHSVVKDCSQLASPVTYGGNSPSCNITGEKEAQGGPYHLKGSCKQVGISLFSQEQEGVASGCPEEV